MATEKASTNTYAVIIGIDFYPNERRDYSTSLNYCVADAREFQRRIETHLENQKVPPEKWKEYLTVLTATIKTPRKTYKAEEKADKLRMPDAKNIIKAMYDLGEKAKKGDIVFISYSGHGKREKTVVEDWLGKSSDLDETLCPWDYGMGGLSVRDFVLNYLINRIVATGAQLTVFLDSCHSGGATRTGCHSGGGTHPCCHSGATHPCCHSGAATRTGKPDQPDDYDEPEVTVRVMPASEGKDIRITSEDWWNVRGPLREKKREIKAAWEKMMQRNSQSPGSVEPLGYSLFTSCLPHEYCGENCDGGFLSTGALDALATLHLAPNKDTVLLKHIYRHIFDKVYRGGIAPSTSGSFLQSPLLIGSVDRPFPGSALDTLPAEVTGSSTMAICIHLQISGSTVEGESPLLYLRAGEAHGVVKGAEYGVYRWFDNPGTPPEVRVVVTQVRNTVSVLTLSGSQTGIPEAWQNLGREQQKLQNTRRERAKSPYTRKAYLLIPKYYPWPTGCVATLISGPPSAAQRIKLLGDVAELSKDVHIPGEIPLTFLPADSKEAEHFRILPSNNMYQLQDDQGKELLPSATSIATCLHNTAHIARYNLLSAISNSNPLVKYFELIKRKPTPEEVTAESINPRSYLTFRWILGKSEIPNKPFVNVCIFHFSPTPEYAIRKVYPIDTSFESVDPADFRNFSIPMTTGTLKAMVFWASTDFDWWQMGPVEVAHVGEPIIKDTPLEEVKQAIPPSPKAQNPDFADIDEKNGVNHWCTIEFSLNETLE